MSSPVDDALADLSRALEGLGDGWYLFGAQAALLRGSRRLTADIDVTLLPGSLRTEQIVERLERHGFELRVADVDDFVQRTRVLPLEHRATSMPVDVVLGGPGLEEMFAQAAESVQLGELEIPVATAEHLVVMKLLAGRNHDLDDAEAIVRGSAVDLASLDPLIEAIAEGLGENDIRRALETLRSRLFGDGLR